MSRSPKRWLLVISTVLGIAAGVLTLMPAAAPFSPLAKFTGAELQRHAEQMRDDCDDVTCARDPKTGTAHMRGIIRLVDGGACDCR